MENTIRRGQDSIESSCALLVLPSRTVDTKEEIPGASQTNHLVPLEHRETVGKLQQEALEYFMALENLKKSRVQYIFHLGDRLAKAKELIGHGNWERWLKRVFVRSKKTAENCMAVHKRLGDRFETICELTPTAVYLLAKKYTPEAAIADVVQRIRGGEKLTTKQIREIILQHKPRVQQQELSEPHLRLRETLRFLHDFIDEQLLEDIEAVLEADEVRACCAFRDAVEKMTIEIEAKLESKRDLPSA